ncbi:hypothetical protein [Parascardovia denticolens]|uniref:hypothetical protein n=1 Tax=Parascardovia denticolens TaxID=78258 RepID=UPI00248E2CBC|nr:hypothetical protein [Parascardovia denticolens]
MAQWKDRPSSFDSDSADRRGKASPRSARGVSREKSGKATMRKVYLRRRLIALLILLLAVALIVGLAIGLARRSQGKARPGAGAGSTTSASASPSGKASQQGNQAQGGQAGKGQQAESSSRSEKSKLSGIPDCTSENLDLGLTADPTTVEAGKTLVFRANLTHKGSKDCLIDASDGSRVLVISSGDTVVYRTDVCDSQARMLLMTDKDQDSQQIAWNTKASTDGCKADHDLKTVQPGNYTAYTYIKDDPALRSPTVPFIITQPPAPSPSAKDSADKSGDSTGNKGDNGSQGGNGGNNGNSNNGNNEANGNGGANGNNR